MATTPLLQLHGIRKAFPGTLANDDVALAILPGEIHALLGENGAVRPGEDGGTGEKIYVAFDDDGKLKGVALASGAQGYQDIVKLLYGYDLECECVRGIKILKMTETPGLGDKIYKDEEFVANHTAGCQRARRRNST